MNEFVGLIPYRNYVIALTREGVLYRIIVGTEKVDVLKIGELPRER